jgi:hypothetical protein
LEDIVVLKKHFDSLSITHVFRERNRLADKLSKEGMQIQERKGITKSFLRDPGGLYHKPFHEATERAC